MQQFQRILVIAFLVLSIICFFATGWVIYVEYTEQQYDVMSILMMLAFAVAAWWSFKKLRDPQ